jgi:hypothetical protein
MPTDFAGTAAAQPGYEILDLARFTPLLRKDAGGEPEVVSTDARAVDVEYHRDIKPILQRSCVGCHSVDGPAEAGLVLDDEAVVDGYENTYNRLCRDGEAEYGIPPVISNGTWRSMNASRYVRMFQARRSLLVWKVFGRRLDGWTNEDHPTEAVAGDPSTIPAGANPNEVDIDYTGTVMPPPGSGYPPLSEEEKITIARWIDLGAPITSQEGGLDDRIGWFADELRPVIALALPAAGRNEGPLTTLRVGMFDYYSGLDLMTFSVVAGFVVNGLAPGTELAPLFVETGDHVWELPLDPPLAGLTDAELAVSVRDQSGNLHAVERTFSVGGAAKPPAVEGLATQADGSVHLRVTGERQEPVAVEASVDLESWSPVKELIDFDGAQQTVDRPGPEARRRFYRAVPRGGR